MTSTRVTLIPQGSVASSRICLNPFLRGFISGLHAGNFDITHIFMDNLYKLAQSSDPKETENFLDWCSVFSAENSVAFTLTIAGEAAEAPEYIARYMD